MIDFNLYSYDFETHFLPRRYCISDLESKDISKKDIRIIILYKIIIKIINLKLV